MTARIYVDTSVIGGCEDDEFKEHSLELFGHFVNGGLRLVLSGLTLQELAGAPQPVRDHLSRVPDQNIEVVQLGVESRELAETYIREGAISENMRADAQHITMASVARVEVLVSWNFRHIVNLQRIQAYNAVNLRTGHPAIEIRAPREILPYE